MKQVIQISPKQRLFSFPSFQELLEYKYLLYVFVLRDLKVRYRQTSAGILWAVLRPLITMVIFTIFFGNILRIPSQNVSYPVFFYSGILIWSLFANGLAASSNSIVQNALLVTRVYFPRIYLPIAAVTKACIDYFFASIVLLILLLYFHMPIRLSLLYVIPIALGTSILAVALGLIFSAFNVRYRDIQHILPFAIQTLFYMSPVLYPSSATLGYSWLFLLNPMTGYIYAHRAAILGQNIFTGSLLTVSIIETIILLVIGLLLFKKAEYYLADII